MGDTLGSSKVAENTVNGPVMITQLWRKASRDSVKGRKWLFSFIVPGLIRGHPDRESIATLRMPTAINPEGRRGGGGGG